MTDISTPAAELGEQIGRELLADRDAKGAPRSAAADLARNILRVNPGAKLPALLVKVRVQQWMVEADVTETMLREALAIERKKLKIGKAKPDLTLPAKRRRAATANEAASVPVPSSRNPAGLTAGPAPAAGLFDDGIVPN